LRGPMENAKDYRPYWVDLKEGPCPHRQSDERDCLFRPIISRGGPSICAYSGPQNWRDHCERFYRMCAVRDIAPGLWGGEEGIDFCCQSFRLMFLKCAEPGGGHMQGAFDIRIYPNDGKDVWRNYARVRFSFCPFCGAVPKPSADDLRRMWDEYRRK